MQRTLKALNHSSKKYNYTELDNFLEKNPSYNILKIKKD